MRLLLDLIAPHSCLGCDKDSEIICGNCMAGLPQLESSCFLCSKPTSDYLTCKKCIQKTAITNLYTAFEYNGLAKEVIKKTKFQYSKDAARVMAELIYDHFAEDLTEVDLVSHIPTATSRIRLRGFDQSAVIAKYLAKLLGCEYHKTLVRTDQSRSTGNSKAERNKQQNYRLIQQPKNQMILLVDDVVTTGTTFKKAASYFDKSNHVIGAAFAKTLLED